MFFPKRNQVLLFIAVRYFAFNRVLLCDVHAGIGAKPIVRGLLANGPDLPLGRKRLVGGSTLEGIFVPSLCRAVYVSGKERGV